jgi:hypothetical protein
MHRTKAAATLALLVLSATAGSLAARVPASSAMYYSDVTCTVKLSGSPAQATTHAWEHMEKPRDHSDGATATVPCLPSGQTTASVEPSATVTDHDRSVSASSEVGGGE